MNRLIASPYLHAFLAGAVAVFGFAPFGLFPLPVIALAVLFWLWSRAERPAQAAWLGFAFGMGLFCAGIGWIYVALHIYGYMHPLLAGLATALFAAVNATLPALAGYAQTKFRALANLHILLIMPAIWTLAEWLRGLLFTGFPWLSMGYSQVPSSPLAGYAPLFGVFGVSLIVAVSAGLLLAMWKLRRSRPGKVAFGILLVLWVGGALLTLVEWTHPQGEPLKVSLLQGNIAQDEKFDADKLVSTLETYRHLAQSSDARLIVLPETALPLLRENVPETYQAILSEHVRSNGGDILIGAFENENGNYYNSVYTLGSSESQHYRKNHLVPFGEFIPLRSVFGWLVNEVLQIPMGDLGSGGDAQAPLDVAGQKVAVNICYEDAFGEEIIRALPEATLLVNVTNDAWYGESHAAMQHNQLSQMRALETGRMVLRATNTGVTSVIDKDGRILAVLPQFEEGVLTAEVQGYVGSTLYVWWGNAGMLWVVLLMLGAAWRFNRNQPTDKE
ncbi:MAG: apolipoprotein N-acyltransferase [Gammaproteobacteria bacterium]|nr:apolipoprotein N-acyltransferase [Gammaproteobacteria bacterium]MBU1775137.1 apolipoprotein N-acyltransferase [Gammaproteobacteria bacterium]MBU1968938.1 apolipoprotein N-acyltransferase [Gammaproteobacteria bacterium]